MPAQRRSFVPSGSSPMAPLSGDGSIPAGGPGVFVVELSGPLPSAPTELTRIGKWIERVETLRLDGERPASRALASRLGMFWLPSQTVLYVGSSEVSVARRVAAIARTELGDRRPASGGNWLKTLRSLDGVRVWWAATTATEEYEDALLTAFAAGVPDEDRASLPDPSIVLPWANLRRPTGERKPTGLTGSLIAEAVEPPRPPTRVVTLPDGDADGANGEPPAPRRRTVAARGSPDRANVELGVRGGLGARGSGLRRDGRRRRTDARR